MAGKSKKHTRERGYGEGSVFRRVRTGADGRERVVWTGMVVLADGKRHTVSAPDEEGAHQALDELLAQQEAGLALDVSRQTVGVFLASWLADVVKPNLRPRTYDSYKQMVADHITPRLGRIELAKLSPQQVQAWLNEMQRSGTGARTVDYARGVLARALSQAVRWRLVSFNAASLARAPKAKPPERQPWTPEQVRAFLAAIAGHPHHALYLVAAATGLRSGEALGLRWEDVDLDAGVLHVRATLQRLKVPQPDGNTQREYRLSAPKTSKSLRDIPLPATLVAALRSHRARQNEDRLRAGGDWTDNGLVFTTALGMPIHASVLSHEIRKLAGRAGLPPVRFHDLRHYAATALVAAGVSVADTMALLGHSNVSTTMGIYAHARQDSKRAAMDAVSALLTGEA
ncbi:MAG: site-specific integrase [Chloroflexota bacterium]|nr:site-specific integrase [Chloroflexota bacterium]